MVTQNYIKNDGKNKKMLGNKLEPMQFSSFAPMHVGELLAKDFPKQKWLVNNLVPMGAITIISAAPNSFKTMTATHLAICVASEKLFYGHFKTSKSGVLIIDEENGDALTQQQLKLLGATKDLPILVRSRHYFVLNDENINTILMDCTTYGLDTVIFDSLIDMHTANENDSGEMGQVMAYFKRLAAAGLTIIVLHHDRKLGQNYFGASTAVRGSSNIYAQADAHLSIRRKGQDLLVVEQTKMRYAAQIKPFEVQVKYDDSSLILEYAGQSKGAQEVKDERLREAIVSLLEENGQLMKREIQEKLRELNIKVHDTKLKQTLEDMIEDKVLDSEPGPGNATYFFLMPSPA